MPTFEFTGPDGKVHSITGPDGSTPEQALEILKTRIVPAPKPEMSWADVPGKAIQNIPSSAANFAKAVAQPFLHPVDTAKAIGAIGDGLLSKAGGALGFEQDQEEKAKREAAANAVGQFYSDRYGSEDGFKRAIAEDPVGVMADFATVLTGGGMATARAGGVVGKAGELAKSVGSALDPIQAVGKVAKAGGNLTANVLGVTSGTGSMPIKQAFRAGAESGNAAFTDAMRGNAPVSNVVDMAESAVGELTKKRGADYTANIASTKADTKVLNTTPIRQTIMDALKEITYEGKAINPSELKALQEAAEAVRTFDTLPNDKGRIAAGLDAMKRAVGGVLESQKPGTQGYRVVKKVYDSIRKEIVAQVPDYAEAMRNYTQASDQIDELKRTFSINPNAASDTTARKLLSVMRNNVNTNFGERARLMDELAAVEPDLPYAIAGHALSSAAPRGLQGAAASGNALYALATNPAALATLPAFSPRVVGEAAYGAGRAAGGAGDTINALAAYAGMSPAAARNALMGAYGTSMALRGGIGPTYDEYGNRRQ